VIEIVRPVASRIRWLPAPSMIVVAAPSPTKERSVMAVIVAPRVYVPAQTWIVSPAYAAETAAAIVL
jgi:hypothetical protein